MPDILLSNLRKTVEGMHNCTASYHKTVYVNETFKDQVVWEGDIYIFAIEGHPEAKLCYTWSSPVDGSDKRRFYAVLHIPPVESAVDAVRASIVSEYREGSE